MTTLFETSTPVIGWSHTLAALFGRATAWNDARLTRKTLGRLSPEQLDDIGLCRGDIDDISAR